MRFPFAQAECVMPDLLFDRERAALTELWRLIEERRTGEEDLTFSSTRAERLATEEGEKTRQALAQKQTEELAELDAVMEQEEADLKRRLAAKDEAAKQSLSEKRRQLEKLEHDGRARIDQTLNDALWMADSVAEGGLKRLQEQVDAARAR